MCKKEKYMFKCDSIRLSRYLYSLGFDKITKQDENGKEYWLFKRSSNLQEALDFFFIMRKKIGVNDYAKVECRGNRKIEGNISEG